MFYYSAIHEKHMSAFLVHLLDRVGLSQSWKDIIESLAVNVCQMVSLQTPLFAAIFLATFNAALTWNLYCSQKKLQGIYNYIELHLKNSARFSGKRFNVPPFEQFLPFGENRSPLPALKDKQLTFAIFFQVVPVPQKQDEMDIRHYVKIKKIPGGLRSDCRIVNGVVCTKNFVHKKMTPAIIHPIILMLACPVDFQVSVLFNRVLPR